MEAVRRAGIRVVWISHPKLAPRDKGKEKEVLAERVRSVEIVDG